MSESPLHSARFDFDPVMKPSVSSSTTTSTSSAVDRWRQLQSTHAARRQQTQAERQKQLQDLEKQVADAASHNQRRTELVTTPNRRGTQQKDNNTTERERRRRSSHSTRTGYVHLGTFDALDTTKHGAARAPQSSSLDHMPHGQLNDNQETVHRPREIDLKDASLEDLEDLIAASAKRLAEYRLKKVDNARNRTRSSDHTISPVNPHQDNYTHTAKHQSDISRLKNMVNGNYVRNPAHNAYSTMPPIDRSDSLELGHTMHDGLSENEASFMTAYTTLGDLADTEEYTDNWSLRERTLKERTKKERSIKSLVVDTSGPLSLDKDTLVSPSASYLSLRSRFETKEEMLRKDGNSFDPLLTSSESTNRKSGHGFSKNDTDQFRKPSRFGPISPSPLSPNLSQQSRSSSNRIPRTNSNSSLGPASISSSISSGLKKTRKKRPVDVSAINVNPSISTNSPGRERTISMTDSPKTPTRLPTPRGNMTATPTFSRTSLPATLRSTHRRLRTLSSIDKDEKTAWLDGDLGLSSTRSTLANATPKIEQPRPSTSTTPRTPRSKQHNIDSFLHKPSLSHAIPRKSDLSYGTSEDNDDRLSSSNRRVRQISHSRGSPPKVKSSFFTRGEPDTSLSTTNSTASARTRKTSGLPKSRGGWGANSKETCSPRSTAATQNSL
ncbi:hypothetical protein CLU79DRAFT_176807 [Phycomyces nitens]|nr:hypothetical protein CLU79DRAFT_176807 [Phycomyces nitens]